MTATIDPLPASPTPYPDVNALLAVLLERVRAVLGADLVGMYLFGSLSLGDFDPASSDVDVVVATARRLPEEKVAALGRVHGEIAASGLPWSGRLEGRYLPPDVLRRHQPGPARYPTIGIDWGFGLGRVGPDWIVERHIVRERGVVVWGQDPKFLIDPVSPDDLRRAVIEAALDFWGEQLAGPEPEWLRTREYQAFARLTMCRIHYTLERGAAASKPVAAAWAMAALPEWAPLIERALAWRHDHAPDDLTDTLRLVAYTVERCQRAQFDLRTDR
ncbi:MAG TPA: aminoglycoside adenylyltransferase domain-containing protein [Thermomicrobiaceae bacterium]|nr:aminoglycoside adenylyltransferase domain-containing protein [Thermomicrobiaceae bacterium]